VVASGFVVQLLESTGYPWIAIAAPFVPLATIGLQAFCSTDPPALPVFTLAETDALLQLTFGADFTSGIGKMGDLIRNRLWWAVCHCDSVLTPVPPAAQLPPAGTPAVVTAYNSVCSSRLTASDAMFHQDGTFDPQFNFTWTSWQNPEMTHFFTGQPLAIQVDLSADYSVSNVTVTFRVQLCSDANGNTPISSADYVVPGHTTRRVIVPVPANALSLRTSTSHTQPLDFFGSSQTAATLLCATATPGITPPCCPPDSYAASALQTILSAVTLIQRQQVPFAYIYGAQHTGLHDTGELTIQGLIGIRLQPTAIPTAIGQEEGDPAEYFDMGWFCWGGTDGFDNRIRLTHSPQTSLPAAAGVYTRIGYSFPPGVTVTITELVREP
jgi:hypothetical protein